MHPTARTGTVAVGAARAEVDGAVAGAAGRAGFAGSGNALADRVNEVRAAILVTLGTVKTLAEPTSDPGTCAKQVTSCSLSVVEIGVSSHALSELAGILAKNKPSMNGVQVGFIHRMISPLCRRLWIGLERSPDVDKVRVKIIDDLATYVSYSPRIAGFGICRPPSVLKITIDIVDRLDPWRVWSSQENSSTPGKGFDVIRDIAEA